MADGFGPGGQDPRGGSDQNNTYRYNYSYGPGRGTTPSGGSRPPKKSTDWGEWVGIAFMMFILPFKICKLIGGIWLVTKLVGLANDPGQQQRYRREADRAAQQAKSAADRARDAVVGSIFDQTFGQDFSASGKSGQQGPGFTQQGAGGAGGSGGAGGGQPGAPGAGRQSGAQQSQDANASHTYRYGQASPQQKEQSQPRPEPWEVKDPREEKKKNRRLSRLKAGGGKGLIIGGSIMAGIFGLGTLAVMTPIFLGEFEYPLLIPIVACLMFAAGGLSMLFSGIGQNRSSERYLNYLAYIGANREVDLAPMAASFDVSVGKLCKNLRRMLAKGILPTGYLDLAEGKLFLTEMGYHAPEPRREAPPEETAQEAAAREDDILREIRQVNDEIPDAVMSAKIDRIEEITGKIFAYQKAHPNKESQLRTFLNYYLPTTLKILRAYAQLDAQGIEGENISAAKQRIEGMMDQVVSGFEKQLDKLFQDDAMDITSDVEVLENMLKKDGLSGEGGITMTL